MSTVDSFDMLQASHLSLYSSNFKHGIMVRSQASVPVRQGIWTTLYEGGQRTLACVEGTAEWRARREADSHRADDAHPLAGHSASEGIVEEDGFQEPWAEQPFANVRKRPKPEVRGADQPGAILIL